MKYVPVRAHALRRIQTLAIVPGKARRSLVSPALAEAFFREHGLVDEPVETFAVALLDGRHKSILASPILLTRGLVNTTLITSREVFEPAIVSFATAVIVAHNHPSGDTTPSGEDRLMTDTFEKAGFLLKVQVVDHLILEPSGGWMSFAQTGLLLGKDVRVY
jgi:DNA repair protein RadC